MPEQDMREKIFEAALEVCAEHGYHGTRMDEIVRRAGVSKGGLYHHFEGKRDLFLQLFDVMMERTISEAGHFSEQATTEEAVHQIFAVFDAWLADERVVRSMMELYMLGLSDDEVRKRFAVAYEGILGLGTQLLRRGMERGEVDPDIDPERAVMALFPAADGLVFMHLILGTFDRARPALQDYERFMLRALRPQS